MSPIQRVAVDGRAVGPKHATHTAGNGLNGTTQRMLRPYGPVGAVCTMVIDHHYFVG